MVRIGFFAGSFDPPTLGHVELARRALSLLDELVVGVGRHAEKTPWLPIEQRLELLRQVLPAGVRVQAFDGLAVAAARAAGARFLVRGLRSADDTSGELQMARANALLAPELETLLLPSSAACAHISSRLVREVQRGGGDVTLFVPPAVAAALVADSAGRERGRGRSG